MKLEMDYVDQVLEFEGLWGAPSVCGLQIAKHADRHVVIASELWDQNPGTSVTNFCGQLADLVCARFELDPDKLVFIEHCPESGSHMEIYEETFHRVAFDRVDGKSTDPDWTRLSRHDVDALLGGD